MLQHQHELCGQQYMRLYQQRNPLLQRHPVLAPLLLLSSSIILGMASYWTDSLFPVFVLIGAPSALICLLLAMVLGTCGILATIINILEHVDRCRFQVALFPESKEPGYYD